jgi:PAS domain S-box-containing protein
MLTKPQLRLVTGLSGGALAFGTLVLLSWSLGRWGWLALDANYVPTAPGTGMMTIVLGVTLLLQGLSPRHRWTSPVVTLLAIVVLTLAITLAMAERSGVILPLEHWFSQVDATRGGVPIGRTALLTSVMFAVIAAGVLLGRVPRVPARFQAGLHLAVAITALLLLQGYLFGGPLMYDRGVIPVAALTAGVLLALSTAALVLTGPTHWPLRLFATERGNEGESTVRDARWLVVLVVAFVGSSGFFWAVAEGDRVQERAERTLLTLANLKADQLAEWYEGFHSTARAVSVLPLTRSDLALADRAATGGDPARAEAVRDWLTALRVESGVTSVVLYDPAGRMLANSPRQLAPLLAVGMPRYDPAATMAGVSSELQHGARGRSFLSFWAPIRTSARDTVVAAWLRFTMDAGASLLPLLRVGSESTPGLELVLWRAVADSAEVVNAVAGPDGTVLPAGFRVPLEPSSEIPGVRGLLGKVGLLRGVDFRGIEVTSAVAPVSGTSWVLAAKMDLAVLRGSVLRIALRATTLSILVALGLGAALLAAWSRRDLAAASRELQLVREREESIQELRRSEERYALAMRGTSDGLWDWDLPTDAVYVSPHWAEMLGMPGADERTMTKDFFGRLHPDDQERAGAHLEAHLRDGGTYSQEVRLRHDDGRYLWFWVRGEALRDASGTPIRMAGAISDITVRREAEDAVLRTDRILRLRSAVNLAIVRAETEVGMLQEITDLAVREGGYRMAWVGRAEPDGERLVRPLVFSGQEGGYLAANSITWSEDDPRGDGPTGRCIRTGTVQAAQDLMAERHFAPWRAAAIAEGFAASCSIPLRRGTEMYGALMLYSAEAHAFDESEITLLTEIGNDVSFGLGALRDHQAVAHQRAELLLFRQVMERSSDAIFITDVITGRFIAFNAAAQSWLGYSAEELLVMGPGDIVPQVGGAPGWEGVVAQIRAEDSVVWPRTFTRKDGTSFPVEVALTAIDTGDREVILSIARDISEREHLMNQLLRSQRMESVGRLAGGVAHDFNNLLTVINATVDLAMADTPAESMLQRDLAEIRGAADRAAALTRQLLAFSRQQVLHQAPLALNDLVSGFLALLRRVIGEDIDVRVDLTPTRPVVMADAGQMEQVLMNLSVNARDAMPTGGTLTFRTSRVHLDEDAAVRHDTMQPGDYALLEVSDTGAGMDRKTQAMIFEPFFTTKAPGKGTGLGLSTVYGIIKQMGGGIWVQSEVGEGTTFKIYLPIAATASVSAPEPAMHHPSTGTETILVVEDESAIRSVVRRVLERAGYTVLEAESGGEALQRIAEHKGPLHLVMTDLVMPGMTGAELAAQLRRTHPDIQVMLTSGYSPDVVAGKIVPGVDCHFLSKPYTAGELTEEIRRVLDVTRTPEVT